MKKQILLIALLIFSSISLVNAQEALTLESAIQIALDKNLNIKVAKNQAEISDNNATKGNAGLLPSLSASGGVNYAEYATDEITSSAGLNFSYTLFDGFGSKYTYKILNQQKEQGSLNARYTIENIISNVISGFYQLSESFDELDVASNNLAISKDRLLRIESKYEFGTINKLEVLNAKVDFNRDSSSYLKAEQSYEELIREMNVLLGRNAEIDYQIIPDGSDFQKFDMVELKKSALSKNAEYLIKASQMREDELAVKKAKSGQLPSLNLNSSYSYYENKVMGSNSNTQLTGGVSMSFNIFDGKRKKIEIANARIQKQNTELEYQDKMLELEKNLVNAYADFQYNLKVLALEEDALEAAQLNFNTTKEYYQLGQVSSTTFREAQLNLVEAQNNKSAARYDAKQSEVSIKKISGILLQ
ncbi:TolC family protein [Ancylomarina sp. 16SWW S1-10-2]|uniref:TolC family protein n=1 Tax=Ancylomarina sp. 16SWW S1-10-2 TaxID=2499681 RepID=UPI0012ADB832|nr:TolC family protein [Ancylomarina sp. 16SWW S1-10-2]MRT94251.1 TolC family protein [Ancylomarina sp. 16SWW S1-10-2]